MKKKITILVATVIVSGTAVVLAEAIIAQAMANLAHTDKLKGFSFVMFGAALAGVWFYAVIGLIDQHRPHRHTKPWD